MPEAAPEVPVAAFTFARRIGERALDSARPFGVAQSCGGAHMAHPIQADEPVTALAKTKAKPVATATTTGR
jgi:hypothetical protein